MPASLRFFRSVRAFGRQPRCWLPVSLVMLILFPNQSQSRQRQKFIDMLNVFRALRHQPRLPARCHHFRIALQLRLDPRQHAIHHVHRAVIQSRLHVRHGICPDHFSRVFDLHARQPRRPRKQRLRSNPDPRRNHSAQVFALRRNHIKRNRRPKIHHDARPAILLKCRHSVHNAVRADFHRVVHQHRHPVFTPGSTNSAFSPEYTRDISASVQFTGGTTELIITPAMAF